MITDPFQIDAQPVKTGNGTGGFNQIQPVIRRGIKITGRIVIAAAGAHIELTAAGEQRFRTAHRQREFTAGDIDQPVEIDQIAPTHKAQRIKKEFTGCVSGNDTTGIAMLATDKR